MGYRSDVRIATTREGYELMCERIDFISEGLGSYPLMGSEHMPDFLDEQGGCVVFGWDSIRWYAGLFTDVTNVVEALEELAECEIPYEFCRVGEEYGDIEFSATDGNEELAMHLYPETSIDIVCD